MAPRPDEESERPKALMREKSLVTNKPFFRVGSVTKFLFFEMHSIFLRRVRAFNVENNESMRTEGAILLSQRYRSAIREGLSMLKDDVNCAEYDAGQLYQQAGNNLCAVEVIWGLFEAICIQPSCNLIVLDLLEWQRDSFPASESIVSGKSGGQMVFGSLVEELLNEKRPEQNDFYWSAIVRRVMCGDLGSAASLLQFHSEYHTDPVFSTMEHILKQMDAALFKDRQLCNEYINLQKKIRELLCEKRAFRLHDMLGVVSSLLIGDRGTFAKCFRMFRSEWFEVFPAYLLYFHPNAQIDHLGKFVEEFIALVSAHPSTDALLDQAVLALLRTDFLEALRLARGVDRDLHWFPVHLVDLLYFHDPTFFSTANDDENEGGSEKPARNRLSLISAKNKSDRGDGNESMEDDVCVAGGVEEEVMGLRSRLLLDHSVMLFATEQMWEIAPDYLLASGLPNAQAILEDHVSAIDWGDCALRACQVLALSERYNLNATRQDLLIALTYKCMRDGEWSGALEWALRTDSIDLQSKVAKRILLNVSPELIGQMRVFGALAEQFLASPELVLLFKFYTFKQLCFQGDLGRGIRLLHELFVDSLSPPEFYAVLIDEMARLLATAQQELGGVAQLIGSADDKTSMDMLRAISMYQFKRNMLRPPAASKSSRHSACSSAQTLYAQMDEQIATLRPMLLNAIVESTFPCRRN